MAQPQHVRNDLHCDALICAFPGYFFGLYSPSLYEKWTLDNPPADSLFGAYAPVYSAADTGGFTTPRKFWTTTDGNGTGGKGIAEYTNRGFFSSGSLFSAPAYPSPTINALQNQMLDVATVCAEAVANGRPGCSAGLSGKITFFSNTVTDSLRTDETKSNPRALSVSIFDEDLKKAGAGPVFALNRFNVDAAQQFLIPRAVGYSAGLINYFFRGKMEISLPDEGIYGIVDHAVENQKDSSGFRKIKLKLKNLTPSGTGIEPMATTGKLVAVAKFHRNTCYQPDLSGEYGSPGMDWRTCRSKDEDIAISAEIAVPDGINDTAQSLMFTFPKPIPINASDVYLQVLYRGTLGAEADAVVVATKDISEPTFFAGARLDEQFLTAVLGSAIYNNPVYTWREGYCEMTQPPVIYDPDCRYKYRLSQYFRFSPPPAFDPANPIASFNATITILNRPMSSYTRFAILGDLNKALPWYSLNQDGGSDVVYGEDGSRGDSLVPAFSSGTALPPNQFDPAKNELLPPYYWVARGIFVPPDEYQALNLGNTPKEMVPPLSPVAPLPSIINSQFLLQ